MTAPTPLDLGELSAIRAIVSNSAAPGGKRLTARLDEHLVHGAVDGGADRVLHLHGLQHDDRLALGHRVPDLGRGGDDLAGHGGAQAAVRG